MSMDGCLPHVLSLYLLKRSSLSGSIIQGLKGALSTDELSTCAMGYFFFSYTDKAKQTIDGMLSTLVAQLCERLPRLPTEMLTLYKKNVTQLCRPVLLEALLIMVKVFRITYLVIDALDEVSSTERDELVNILQSITTNPSFSKTNLIVTSRRESYLVEGLTDCMGRSICLTSRVVDSDIESFVSQTVQNESKFIKWPQDLKTLIVETLTSGAKGM